MAGLPGCVWRNLEPGPQKLFSVLSVDLCVLCVSGFIDERSVKDKVVIITGASKGIGAELARQLAAKGAKLVLAARGEQELEAVAAECRKRGAEVIAVRADVAIERDCQAVVAGAVTAFGRLDALVNNAGATMWARFEDVQDMSILERIMQVNYMGAVYCTHHALPFLRESKGLIVGISSLAGRTGVPTRTGYSAAKHAMTGFFDSLRIELARQRHRRSR